MPSSTLTELIDTHIHEDFLAEEVDGPCICQTVSPARWHHARNSREHAALGLHPWWIAAGICSMKDAEMLAVLAPETRLIGEVGLDFYGDHAASAKLQTSVFERMCQALADGRRRFISLHARKAEKPLLDMLELYGLPGSSICCLHSYSGPSDELLRAVRMGCWFSVSARNLATKKWRAYIRAVPRERILLETDFPPTRIIPAPEDAAGSAAPLSPSRRICVEPKAHAQALEDALALLGPIAREQIIENQREALGEVLP